jgi:hypothetical protein
MRHETEDKRQRKQEILHREQETERTGDMRQRKKDREDKRHAIEDKRQRRQET